ncbi:MAG: 50S ribosomal protein L4 [Candidatus Omnitrophica bacterium]|nr:50S ribosomal protein L4 [Candidatus Omnitrophota bacterium]MDD5652988.1 50S ribosomal protein L4 [Candidatus Omnitrophota bacterium]
MEAITLPVYNTEGKEVETIKLDTAVFDGEVNSAAIHQAITAYRANQRTGLAATKTRGEVSGGGRKPWKQKGTGRARVGSTRSPLWRHGGVVFGPHPRDFSYTLPQKIKSVALKSSLNAKVKENNFVVLDTLEAKAVKTKEMNKVLSNLKVLPEKHKASRVLLLSDNLDNNLKLSLRNINFLDINLTRDTNVYEVLSARKLVITKSGLAQLTKRLK